MPDQTPAQTLTAAAKLLRSRAENATAGPWVASPVRSPRSTVTSGIYSHAHPAGSAVSEVAASGRTGRGCGGVTNPNNASYIATVHPGVGLALADWLEHAAKAHDANAQAAASVWDSCNPVEAAEAAEFVAKGPAGSCEALAVARAVLGGAS